MPETLKASCHRSMRALARDRRGTIALLVAFLTPVLLGVVGLSVDVGRAYVAKRQLQDATQAAALAGAAALAKPNGTAATVATAISAWQQANPPAGLTVAGMTTSLVCDSTTTGLPACNAANPNVVKVTQTASVPTYFLKALGRTSLSLAATVAAAKAGGEKRPLNIMFVLDVTGSMAVPDTCTIEDIASPTKIQCALSAIQAMLKGLPTAQVKVGLMIFPGMASQWRMTPTSCGTQPAVAPYLSAGITYQVGTTLDDTYNDGAGRLAVSSPLVVAVGNYPTKRGCVEFAGGGQTLLVGPNLGPSISGGSYGAEAIDKAKAALPAGEQGVIIVLSDGDYNVGYFSAMSQQVGMMYRQCARAVQAATNAKDSNTVVYGVAWGPPGTGCPFDDAYRPCATMKAIASDATRFYTTTADCQIAGSPNRVAQLPAILAEVSRTLSKPRIVLAQ